MSFEDRFSGRVVGAPPAGRAQHAGRWIVKVEAVGTTHVNGLPACLGDALMPALTGDWEVAKPGLENATVGRFFADAPPNDQDANALRQLGDLLRDRADDGWLGWSEINPLAPGLDEAVRPHRFEEIIENELQHLEAVCRKPRTHIRLEVERELVARARRIARDAPQWLTAHTEDWHRRTLTGVQPRRIRAEIREERWDLYENRVAARLVDNLVGWLRRRHAQVRRIRDDILMRIKKLDDTAHGGSRHRAERIYGLWGEAWEAGWQEVADGTVKRIERLLYKVLALQDSRLYHQVPRRAQVPLTLRMTNLLTTDDHYRGIARLWRRWSLLPTQGAISARMHYQQQQALHQSFDEWCMLLVIRACSQLELDPANDDEWQLALAKGRSVRLEKSLCIEWEESGAISLTTTNEGGKTLCRFVPLLHSLERARTTQALAQRIAPIVEAVADRPHWTVVLHPASPGDTTCEALATVGNPPQPSTVGTIDFIRVSPYALDSVERVARAIRWATLAPRMLAYPPSVSAPPDESVGKELRLKSGTDTWTMNAVPRDHRRVQHEIERRLEDKRAQLEKLKHRRDVARRERRSAKRLSVPIDAAERRVKEWEIFKQDVDDALTDLCELQTCPRCGRSAEFHERSEGCFAARCESASCRAQWELRALRDGKGRVPVFDPDGRVAAPYEIDGLVDCDILAVLDERDQPLPPRRDPVNPELSRLLRP